MWAKFRPSRGKRHPLWAAYGGNGSVVDVNSSEVVSERRYEVYWAAEALRAWAEGDRQRGNRYLRLALVELERQEQND